MEADTPVSWRITHPLIARTHYDVALCFESVAETAIAWIAQHHPEIDPWDGLCAEWCDPTSTTDREEDWKGWEEHPAYLDVGTPSGNYL